MEEPPVGGEKKSEFELPEVFGFKIGDAIRLKKNPEKEYTIFGFIQSRNVVRMFSGDGQPLDVSPTDLKEFERVPPAVWGEIEDLVS
jgi:hypothetical protein